LGGRPSLFCDMAWRNWASICPQGENLLYAAIGKLLIFNDLQRVPQRNACSELAQDVLND